MTHSLDAQLGMSTRLQAPLANQAFGWDEYIGCTSALLIRGSLLPREGDDARLGQTMLADFAAAPGRPSLAGQQDTRLTVPSAVLLAAMQRSEQIARSRDAPLTGDSPQ